jgi:hypothetical protein
MKEEGGGTTTPGKKSRRRIYWERSLYFGLTMIATAGILVKSTIVLPNLSEPLSIFGEDSSPANQVPRTRENKTRKRAKIAIISTFVPSRQWGPIKLRKGRKQLNQNSVDMLVNKACYAHRWGYDFILNMTYGFHPSVDNPNGTAYWQEYGSWSRVPHIRDRIHDYEWILYSDIDHIFLNMSRPIEAFMEEWESHNLTPSILAPRDVENYYTFSDFALTFKNSTFSSAVLNHWMNFARGLCPNGNLRADPLRYTWEDSDQPGIWYALTQTHKDFFGTPNEKNATPASVCSVTTGLIQTDRAYGLEMNQYFLSLNLSVGCSDQDLRNIPKDQPILWSRPSLLDRTPVGGLGIQMQWGDLTNATHARAAWAAHVHAETMMVEGVIRQQLNECKQVHGCYAHYAADGTLKIGCKDHEFTVAAPRVSSQK